MKKIMWLVLIILLIYCLNSFVFRKTNVLVKPYYEKLGDKYNISDVANISNYAIYGKYLNIEGNITYTESFDDLKIVLKSENNEIEYNTIYNIDELNSIVNFKTSDYINRGILLENINIDNYVFLLKVTKNESIIYYHFYNKTSYSSLDYYTMTFDNSNKLIHLDNKTYNDKYCMTLEIKDVTLPENVYDVVIDPGHGGIDSGAVNGKYQEKNINLEYALLVKKALEELGLKVKLTREDDTALKHYGYGSRTGIPYETKAKLMLSIHLNSGSGYGKGVEVYVASHDDIYFAKLLANNIANLTSTTYSRNSYNRIENGVYLRTYTKSDIDNSIKKAQKEGWTPYDFNSDDITYYYFIRETGSVSTKAFADGRNPEYETNPYYNVNYGVEAYLLELGYLSNSKNLKVILNEKEKYVAAIKDSVKYYLYDGKIVENNN